MPPVHLITCEYPPLVGGVSEHSRVLVDAASRQGKEVIVWTRAGDERPQNARVRTDLGDFSSKALSRAGAALNESPAPRRLIVQWVPHGYGRKGLNVVFARWLRDRARAGDRIDLIVHEPFVDFIGSSWHQPLVAAVQRYMTWMVVRAADRVWLTIPGWESRVKRAIRPGQALGMLPVPGTIPPIRDDRAVAALRTALLAGRSRLVGYFGTGGAYTADVLRRTTATLASRPGETAFVCIGRGSDVLASGLQAAVPGLPIAGTGTLRSDRVSLHLQACDALLQPYPDGVSGRRTTTVSALEHGIPVATTFGALSEPFWNETPAVESAPVAAPAMLPAALTRLLDPARNAVARRAAVSLYRQRFDPSRTLNALLGTHDIQAAIS